MLHYMKIIWFDDEIEIIMYLLLVVIWIQIILMILVVFGKIIRVKNDDHILLDGDIVTVTVTVKASDFILIEHFEILFSDHGMFIMMKMRF